MARLVHQSFDRSSVKSPWRTHGSGAASERDLARKVRLCGRSWQSTGLPQVEDARAAGLVEHDVGRLEVAVQEPDRTRDRLNYPLFRQLKIPLGSSVIESAVRRVVNLRLKGPGIKWC